MNVMTILRIVFKILCIIFKCIYFSTAPVYLKELIIVNDRNYMRLRSDEALSLKYHPPARTKTYGKRAFSIEGPALWNALPAQIRQITSFEHFKTRLKTHLFTSYYT